MPRNGLGSSCRILSLVTQLATQSSIELPSAVNENFSHLYYLSHARFGNTVSASVPLAMSQAEREGRLSNGAKVGIAMALGRPIYGLVVLYLSQVRFRFCR